jgi:hypothetical protein
MTTPDEALQKVQKIVIFFDFCSSTTILEDLLKSENQQCWRNLLIELKDFLLNKFMKHWIF